MRGGECAHGSGSRCGGQRHLGARGGGRAQRDRRSLLAGQLAGGSPADRHGRQRRSRGHGGGSLRVWSGPLSEARGILPVCDGTLAIHWAISHPDFNQENPGDACPGHAGGHFHVGGGRRRAALYMCDRPSPARPSSPSGLQGPPHAEARPNQRGTPPQERPASAAYARRQLLGRTVLLRKLRDSYSIVIRPFLALTHAHSLHADSLACACAHWACPGHQVSATSLRMQANHCWIMCAR